MPNYPLLRRYDVLPAVGVLQQLLNRQGATLDLDGNFGPITSRAVKDFQRIRGLKVDGIVGIQTWPRISTGTDLPIIDCVDIFDPLLVRDTEKPLEQAGGNPLVIGGMCNGVDQAVNMILSASPGDVFLLRFHGHGGPGDAGVSDGRGDLDPDSDQRADISISTLDDLLPVLSHLRPIFGSYGCIQFMHCQTGRGPEGHQLLSRLANALGVPVSAALNDQFGLGGGPLPFGLQPPTVTAVPGGKTLAAWVAALPQFAGMSVR